MRHFIIVYIVVCVRSADLLLGDVGGSVIHLIVFIVMCVRFADLLLALSVGFSLLSIVFEMCVGSANLLLGYVGGSLTHHFNVF